MISARHGYDLDFLFDSTQSPKVLIQLTMALQELIQISSRLKTDFRSLIQIDSRLKKLPEYFHSNQLTTQKKTFQNFDSNRLIDSKNV